MVSICKRILSHQNTTRPKIFPSLSITTSFKSKTSSIPELDYSPSSSSSDMALDDPIPFTSTTYIEEEHQVVPKVPIGWEVRFDPTLGEYYYLNQISNLIQLDHPEEVLSPISRHNSCESVFLKRKTTPTKDSNYKLSRYGDHNVENDYTERALNHHFLLANGTGIVTEQERKTKSTPSFNQVEDYYDDDLESIVSTISNSSVDRTMEYNFYNGNSKRQDDEEDDEDSQEIIALRLRMLLEVKSCEMAKLATV